VAHRLSRLLHLPRPYARRAYAQPLGRAIHYRADILQIQIPPALGDIMGMTDAVAELRAATAHFANSCHYKNLLKTAKLLV